MHLSSVLFLVAGLCSVYFISPASTEKCSALCDCSGTWVRCNNVESLANLDLRFAKDNIENLEISAVPPARQDSGRRLLLPKDFARFTKLKRLDVDNSGVSIIPEETAKQLANLQELDLHGNRIYSLRNLNLDQMTNLQSLVLDGNFIKRIRAGDLSKNQQLRELFLDNNDVDKLGANSLGNMPNLRRVMLKGNTNLKVVHEHAFNGSEQIEHLDFVGTKLRRFPKALANLKNLETLDMDNTKLSHVTDEDMAVFKPMFKLHLVDVSHTDIKCTEQMKKFMEEMEALKMFGCPGEEDKA